MIVLLLLGSLWVMPFRVDAQAPQRTAYATQNVLRLTAMWLGGTATSIVIHGSTTYLVDNESPSPHLSALTYLSVYMGMVPLMTTAVMDETGDAGGRIGDYWVAFIGSFVAKIAGISVMSALLAKNDRLDGHWRNTNNVLARLLLPAGLSRLEGDKAALLSDHAPSSPRQDLDSYHSVGVVLAYRAAHGWSGSLPRPGVVPRVEGMYVQVPLLAGRF